MKVSFKLNGGKQTWMCLLIHHCYGFLRYLGMVGTKFGCGKAQLDLYCSFERYGCTFQATNWSWPRCNYNRGLVEHKVQRAWMALDVPQCGWQIWSNGRLRPYC